MRNSGSDFTRGDQCALDEFAQSDLLLDALAARTESGLAGRRNHQDFEDRALAELLGEWRDDLRWPPASALVSQEEAEEALREGMRERHRPDRGRRRLAAVGSVAATLLALSGFGAVVADAKPGDALYGLHAMVFNEPRVGDDQIVLSAKADLAKVEQMIAQGQWDQAQTQLAEVSTTLQGVNDGSRRQGLLAEVNQLNTKVEKRDPAAAPAAVGPPAPLQAPGTAQPTTSSPGPATSSQASVTTTAPAPSASPSPSATPVPSTSQPKPSASTPPQPSASLPETPTTTTKTKHRRRESATPSESAASPPSPSSSKP